MRDPAAAGAELFHPGTGGLCCFVFLVETVRRPRTAPPRPLCPLMAAGLPPPSGKLQTGWASLGLPPNRRWERATASGDSQGP